MIRRLALALTLALATTGAVAAQSASQSAAAGPVHGVPRRFVREHSGRCNGVALRYTATVDEIVLSTTGKRPAATAFTTAYEVRGAGSRRPVLFLFNGGPGSPSMWLHMGAFGPQRVTLPADLRVPVDPSRAALIDNPDTVLDVADIVLIDVPGTGFGRIAAGPGRENLYSVDGDAAAVADIMLRWIAAHGRDRSPFYLLGKAMARSARSPSPVPCSAVTNRSRCRAPS